jgi:hypothetical protein
VRRLAALLGAGVAVVVLSACHVQDKGDGWLHGTPGIRQANGLHKLVLRDDHSRTWHVNTTVSIVHVLPHVAAQCNKVINQVATLKPIGGPFVWIYFVDGDGNDGGAAQGCYARWNGKEMP